MFDFFEGLIENLGIKLVGNFTDKLIDFIKNAKEGSKGDNNCSGDSAQIGSSGNYAQIGSSGDYAQIDISGNNTVGFVCGWQSIIKAKKGTWISLCEWKTNKEMIWMPVFALSAQIGNKDYKDFKGRILKETEYYCLHNQKFYPVDLSDGVRIIKILEKKRDNIKIIKGITFDNKEVYLVKEGELSAHGTTMKEAINDLTFKKMKSKEVKGIIQQIKETGKVNRLQYRAITGACQFGTEQFCKEHNIEDLEEIEIEELRKILINEYGAKEFWDLIDKE